MYTQQPLYCSFINVYACDYGSYLEYRTEELSKEVSEKIILHGQMNESSTTMKAINKRRSLTLSLLADLLNYFAIMK